MFQSLRWRNIGPLRGGRSIAASGVAARKHEAYFGAIGGGLWKTTDYGVTWNPVTDNQISSSSVGAVAVSDSNPDVVFIGMGESLHSRQHHAGRRRLQVERRRQDVDPVRLQHARSDHLEDSHSPDQSRRRLRGGLRQHHGARATSAASSSRSTAARRGRRRSFAMRRTAGDRSVHRSEESQRDVRRPVGGVSPVVSDVERRAGQRPLQVHRRRRDAGPRLPATPAYLRASSGASAWPCRRPTRIACSPSSRTTTAGCSCPTMPAHRGSRRATIAGCVSARSTTRTSMRTRKAKDTVYVLNVNSFSNPSTAGRPTASSRRRTATITTCGSIPTIPHIS